MARGVMFLLLLGACKAPRVKGEPCGDPFDTDGVQTLSIEIAEEEWEALQTEYLGWEARRTAGLEIKPYHPVERLDYQCQTVFDAHVRLKGNPCCSWDDAKMQFTFKFNEEDHGNRFMGLRKIALDAPYYDPSLLRERVAYSALEDMGQHASRVNHVELVVNGVPYGVYANVEVLDREWLQDRMTEADAEGTLWKLDYLDARMEPRTNEDTADYGRWSAHLDATTLEELDVYMDLDASIDGWSAEVLVNQADGYWVGGVNFFVYDHPRLGFQVLPWDLDNTWDRWPPNVAPTTRSGSFGPTAPMQLVLDDPAWSEIYVDRVAERHALLDPELLVERLDAWEEELRPYVEADPSRPYSLEAHDEAVAAVRTSIRERHAWLGEWLESR